MEPVISLMMGQDAKNNCMCRNIQKSLILKTRSINVVKPLIRALNRLFLFHLERGWGRH